MVEELRAKAREHRFLQQVRRLLAARKEGIHFSALTQLIGPGKDLQN